MIKKEKRKSHGQVSGSGSREGATSGSRGGTASGSRSAKASGSRVGTASGSREGAASGSRGGAASGSGALPIHKVSAAKLRAALTKARMSKTELARRTGYELRFIEKLLAGEARRAGVDEVETLANALAVDPSALVSRRGLQGA